LSHGRARAKKKGERRNHQIGAKNKTSNPPWWRNKKAKWEWGKKNEKGKPNKGGEKGWIRKLIPAE